MHMKNTSLFFIHSEEERHKYIFSRVQPLMETFNQRMFLSFRPSINDFCKCINSEQYECTVYSAVRCQVPVQVTLVGIGMRLWFFSFVLYMNSLIWWKLIILLSEVNPHSSPIFYIKTKQEEWDHLTESSPRWRGGYSESTAKGIWSSVAPTLWWWTMPETWSCLTASLQVEWSGERETLKANLAVSG